MDVEQSFKVTVRFQRRPDGGLRAWSDDVPELVLSNRDPEKVMADIVPAIEAILSARLQAAMKAERLVDFAGRDRFVPATYMPLSWLPTFATDLIGRIEPLARRFYRLEFSAHRCAA
ncbi:MAG: hypothetical protein QM608_02790 [Caulobacter sp.]